MVINVVRADSIQFDIERAKELAEARHWDLREWARRADVSVPTLREWLRGSATIKIRTVDDILRPLGLTAADLIRNGKKN